MPSQLPARIPSTKNRQTPSSTAAQVTMSRRLGRVWKKSAISRITNTGAVNCSTMLLAAVVSLLDTAKSAVTPIMDSAPRITGRLITIRWRRISKYRPITAAPIRFLAPLMASAAQGISLMKRPPVLNATEARKTHKTDPQRAVSAFAVTLFPFCPCRGQP